MHLLLFLLVVIGSGPRCYNAKDQELNSTSWFVNYIGNFVTFITPDDLATFINSSQVCQASAT